VLGRADPPSWRVKVGCRWPYVLLVADHLIVSPAFWPTTVVRRCRRTIRGRSSAGRPARPIQGPRWQLRPGFAHASRTVWRDRFAYVVLPGLLVGITRHVAIDAATRASSTERSCCCGSLLASLDGIDRALANAAQVESGRWTMTLAKVRCTWCSAAGNELRALPVRFVDRLTCAIQTWTFRHHGFEA
jgi:hypothetical protein